MARHHPTCGRGLSDSVCLPVDTSSRAFRRSCSEPRFPFASIDRNSVLIKSIPISLRWDSANPHGGVNCANAPHRNADFSPEQKSDERPVDPHRTGFGRIPDTLPRIRSPPACKVSNGILGVHPSNRTSVEDPGLSREQVKVGGGDGTLEGKGKTPPQDLPPPNPD